MSWEQIQQGQEAAEVGSLSLESPGWGQEFPAGILSSVLFFVLLEVWLVSFVHSGNPSVLRGEFSVPNNQKPLPETGVNMI